MKFEAQIPKFEANSKLEFQKFWIVSDFEFRDCFELRISSFGFGLFTPGSIFAIFS
jgi:hypothetical protein